MLYWQPAAMLFTVLLALLFCCVSAIAKPLPCPSQVEQPCSAQELWFEGQLVDHLSWNHTRTWRQRYLTSDSFFKKSTGPIFFYGGGRDLNACCFLILIACSGHSLLRGV